MRFFTLVVSAVFVIIGVWMIADGTPNGWLMTGFFGVCLLVAVFEPWLSRSRGTSGYRVSIAAEDIARAHPRRTRGSIRWVDVNRVWYVTTSQGPRLPNEWILLEGENGGCSFRTEVAEIESVWDEIKQRFPGFDYRPVLRGGAVDARHLCWERRRVVSAQEDVRSR